MRDEFSNELMLALRAVSVDDVAGVYRHARRAISLQPSDLRSYAVASEIFDPAFGSWFLERASLVAPDEEPIWTRLVRYRQWLGQWALALHGAKKALALAPHSLATCMNLAALMRDVGRPEPSLSFFSRALNIEPVDREAPAALASVLFSLGRFSEGALPYAKRLGLEDSFDQAGVAAPQRLVLRAEQGLGDQILQLHALDSDIALEAVDAVLLDSRLITIARRSFPGWKFSRLESGVPSEPARQRCLADVLVKDAPAIIGRRVTKTYQPLLRADLAMSQRLRRDLLGSASRLIGISLVSTNPSFGHLKTVRPNALVDMFNRIQGNFVDLSHAPHRNLTDDEVALWSQIIPAPMDPSRDLDGLAAAISACDVVVCISGTVAHLAGALGVSTCVLVPFGAGRLWYWENRQGDRSAWYPSVRLFDQDATGSWRAAVAGVVNFLESH